MQKLLIGLGIFAALVFGLLFWLVWTVLEKFEPGQVRFWGALITAGGPFVILAVYALGFAMGKTEAKGALRGLDAATERIARVVSDTVNVRDSSRIRVNNQLPQVGKTVVLFDPSIQPQITHRSTARESGDIIDLSE